VAVKYVGRAVDYLLGGPMVGGAEEVRLRRWLSLPEAPLTLPHAEARYVVVDVATGTSGVRGGAFAAIGAVAVARMAIDLGDCFSAVLGRGAARGPDEGRAGADGDDARFAAITPAGAMLDFLDYLGPAPLVAFEMPARRRAVERAVKSILGVPFRRPWIDLSLLLPALYPDTRCATLDDWLANFGLRATLRHDAVVDAYAAAELLQIALSAADRRALSRIVDIVAPKPAQRRPGGH
jgi:DNA polymerase-3 subunit epsilon